MLASTSAELRLRVATVVARDLAGTASARECETARKGAVTFQPTAAPVRAGTCGMASLIIVQHGG
jgi:hypothetical protein